MNKFINQLEKLSPILSPKLVKYHENDYNIFLIYAALNEVIKIILIRGFQTKNTNQISDLSKEVFLIFVNLLIG